MKNTEKKLLTVGFLQPEATFTHLAAQEYFGNKATYLPLETHSICEALNKLTIDYGVLPIENLSEGTVGTTMDSVLENQDISVTGEIILPIHHHLLSKDPLTRITRIYSHQQALSQSQTHLNQLQQELGHKIELVHEASTARGAERASQDTEPGAAALATDIAAKKYGLKIVRENMEDKKDNATRFWILSKNKQMLKSGNDKTAFSFDVTNSPGALVSVLHLFSERGLSATMLQSRPSKLDHSEGIWEYTFFVEFLGHIDEKNLSEVFTILQNGNNPVCKRIRILGSYPRFPSQN
jgi:chorismate mutase/prephenate dehydratase